MTAEYTYSIWRHSAVRQDVGVAEFARVSPLHVAQIARASEAVLAHLENAPPPPPRAAPFMVQPWTLAFGVLTAALSLRSEVA